MFNPKMWQAARHLFDSQNTKQSVNVGIGAGVAILATGSGVLSALVAAGIASSAAMTIRTLWDEYKKKNATAIAPEQPHPMAVKQQARDQLYNAWNDSFNGPPGNMRTAVTKLNAFHETLSAHNRKNGVDDASMLLAEQLYDRLVMAQGFQGGDTHMFVQLENIKQSTLQSIKDNAPRVAFAAVQSMQEKAPIEGSYNNAMGQVIATRDAARLQSVAARLVPDSYDDASAKKIVNNLAQIQAAVALGMDASTGDRISTHFLSLPETIKKELEIAREAVDNMNEKRQEAKTGMDNAPAFG